MTVEELAATFGDVDAIVFSAGSNGGSKEVTKAIDGDGVGKAIKAARLAGVERVALVSVLPESWRERDLGEDVEYYFAVSFTARLLAMTLLALSPSCSTSLASAGRSSKSTRVRLRSKRRSERMFVSTP